MDDKKMELFPVGRLITREACSVVQIMPDYRPALKYLDEFSHGILFVEGNQPENFPGQHFQDDKDQQEEIRSAYSLRKGKVLTPVVKIIKVDQQQGMVVVDRVPDCSNSRVYDIKPYFPCEDRVRHCSLPGPMEEWQKWRNEEAEIYENIEIKAVGPDFPLGEKHTLKPLGQIRKIQGTCFLRLFKVKDDLLVQLKGFSHLKLIWWFNRFDRAMYRQATQCNPPYENAPRTGIFASRSPVRPNPIAMTTVRIVSIDLRNQTIEVSGLDAFDKTPVIDVIPYVPALDRVKEYTVPKWLNHWPEWLEDQGLKLNAQGIKIGKGPLEQLKPYMALEKQNLEGTDNLFQNQPQRIDSPTNEIIIRGVRQHNLKNISTTIPKNKMTVITGVSGSGKSSLAFDTLYAESQRRFIDSMSALGKGALEPMDKPDFDQILGLPPAIAVEQKNQGRNPRSTVGTFTEIYDFLRLLFSSLGVRHCPECGRTVKALEVGEIPQLLFKLLAGTQLTISPLYHPEKKEAFIVPNPKDEKWKQYKKRLENCIPHFLTLGKGAIEVLINQSERVLLQTREMCYHCNHIFFALTTSTFSFNHPESMCPVCRGLGVNLEVNTDLIVSKPNLSILDGASKWWGNLGKFSKKPNANWMKGEVLALAEDMKVDLALPWKELPPEFREQALYGSNGRVVKLSYETGGRRGEIARPVEGAVPTIERLFKEGSGAGASPVAMEFMQEKTCPHCNGEGLNAEARHVSIASTRFPEAAMMTVEELRRWIEALPQQLRGAELKIVHDLLISIHRRLDNLLKLGLSYLTLDRRIPTLSGGELQRLRLASLLSSGITNILYVLDEPSTGLHPRDHKPLIEMLQQITEEGNTVVIVEHDRETMLAADKIIDMGPGAGTQGGMIVAAGSPQEVMQNSASETGKYLAGMEASKEIVRKIPRRWIKIKGAKTNNLKNIDVNFPLGVLTCITGVSGSGKSSLAMKTLYPAVTGYVNHEDSLYLNCKTVEGLEGIDGVVCVTQQPIGRTPRSNPATYTGVFDHIRKLFASTEGAKKKGLKQNSFSFNSGTGQCQTCHGEGRRRIEMHYMPDIWVECPVCRGKRFNADVLEVKYHNRSIAEVLAMNVEEALAFFKEHKSISDILQTLYDVGLGYIKLGQSALTLSGGEAQRIKLAKELAKAHRGKNIYLLDEPTTGLHFSDVDKLLSILQHLTKMGNTVIIVTHHIKVINQADYVIDMGPEGGLGGGYIVAQGTPEEIASIEGSHTGRLLKKIKTPS